MLENHHRSVDECSDDVTPVMLNCAERRQIKFL